MKFFKGKLVQNIYIFIAFVMFLIGSLIVVYGDNKELVFGVGKVLQYSFGILCILLLILYILPRKVFSVWKYISIPFVIYIISYSASIPVFNSCFLLNCDRYANVSFATLLISLLTLAISIVVAIVWHFVEKHNRRLVG